MAQTAEPCCIAGSRKSGTRAARAAIDELMADDAIVHGIAGPDGKEITGAAGFKPFFQQFRTAFPDMRIHRSRTRWWTATRSRCAAAVTATPYRSWRYGGRRPARAASFTGMCIARVKDGKIVEGWNNFDFLSLYQQLGMQLN